MPRGLRRGIALGASIGLMFTGLTMVDAASAAPSAARTVDAVSVKVSGTLLATSPEPGVGIDYAVALPDGALLPIKAEFATPPPARAGFTGSLVLPPSVRGVLLDHGYVLQDGSALSPRSTAGREAVKIADLKSLTLRATDIRVTAPVSEATSAPATHRLYIAAPSNLGTLPETDPEVLGTARTVAAFWEDEANGDITDIQVPSTVLHYPTSVTGAAGDCGLGSSSSVFTELVGEAEAKFPSANFTTGADQLAIFVPPDHCSGGALGRGYVGNSFADGGATITMLDPAYAKGALGHEMGHNYGFNHANLGPCGSEDCSTEYGGIYDVMGYGIAGVNQLTALSTAYRVSAGVTDPGEIETVGGGDGTRVVSVARTLAPRSDESGLRSLQVRDPDTGQDFYVDYRSGTGQDAGSAYAAGFNLSATGGTYMFRPGIVMNRTFGSQGLEVIPDGQRVAMVSGDIWRNVSHTLEIAVGEVTPSGAQVTVTYTPGAEWTSTGTVSIGGSPQVGNDATAVLAPDKWVPAVTGQTLQWYVDGVPVPDENTDTFFAAPGQVGKQLTVSVDSYGPGVRPDRQTSAPVTIRPGDILATPPTVGGTPRVGEDLTGIEGSWSPLMSPAVVTWQWRANGVDIPGATALTHTVTSAEAGKRLTLAQTLTAAAYVPVTNVSDPTDVVAGGPIPGAPAPVISGTPKVAHTLTAVPGSWPAGTSLAYQWKADGASVSGATARTFTPGAAQQGRRMTVTLTGTRTGSDPTQTVSAATSPVAAGTLVTRVPKISGRAKKGRRLTAVRGTWTSGTTFTYRWYANNVAIRRATSAKFTLTRAQKGKRIRVKVTGRKSGYTAVSRTSARTTRVTS